jgi:cell division protease FtsH
VHTKNKKLDPSVDLEQIAKQNPHMSGAQLWLSRSLFFVIIITINNVKYKKRPEEQYFKKM